MAISRRQAGGRAWLAADGPCQAGLARVVATWIMSLAASAMDLPRGFRDRTFVVVPARNEAGVAGNMVRELAASFRNVVVVDDGSSDHTASEAAAAGARVLRHVVNRGQGAALQTGIDYCLAHGAATIVTFDADGQHDATDLPALLEPIYRGQADVVLGSRFIAGGQPPPLARGLLLRSGVWFTRLLSGARVTDTHNGLRAFSRAAASRIRITLDRMAHASEMIDQIQSSGLRFVEVPVHVRYTPYSRSKGQSGLDALAVAADYLLRRIVR